GALDVHVLDAVGDVMTPRQHVVVAAWVHAEVARVLARHRVESKVARLPPFVKPGVVAVGELYDGRRHVLVLCGKPVKPNAGMFDDMVVNGNDSCIFGKHMISFCKASHLHSRTLHALGATLILWSRAAV